MIARGRGEPYVSDYREVQTLPEEVVVATIFAIAADESLTDGERSSLLWAYTHAWCGYHEMEFTPETAAETAKGNDRLSECCVAGGRQLVAVKRMLERLHASRGRVLTAHYVQGNLNVAREQPLVTDPVMKALLAAQPYLECKTYWFDDENVDKRARGIKDAELVDRLTVLRLMSEDDDWNECLPKEWCGDMKLTGVFDRLCEVLHFELDMYGKITDYYVGVDESYEL